MLAIELVFRECLACDRQGAMDGTARIAQGSISQKDLLGVSYLLNTGTVTKTNCRTLGLRKSMVHAPSSCNAGHNGYCGLSVRLMTPSPTQIIASSDAATSTGLH